MGPNRDVVELLHLHFIRLLATGRDKAGYIIKGGCNLRFYFGSIRYSEDLDLDVEGLPPHVVKDKVAGILASNALRETLASRGITLASVTTPKQTPTTQRWKIELRAAGRAVALHTKIELSHRGPDEESGLEAVDARVLQRHQLMPVLACHYLLPAALRQKVGALVGRREVQARDVFDLSVLCARAGADLAAHAGLRAQTPAAIDRVFSLSYSDYKAQVVAYLEPAEAGPLASEEAWEAMQLQVVSWLESLPEEP